ncbi:MAG: hypothetical protein WKF93_11860 [Acidimicrobiales bacterium]
MSDGDDGGVLIPGLATCVGSLPHTDPARAAATVLGALPDLPAAPSLPRRHHLEAMIPQAAWGITGVTVAPDGSLLVDPTKLDVEANPADDPRGRGGLPLEGHRGAVALLDAMAAARAGPGTGHGAGARAVKVQHTGPVTLGLALVAAGARPAVAFAVAATAVRHRVHQLLAVVATTVPGLPVVLVLDEPSLGAATLGHAPIGVEEVVDLLSGGLAAAESAPVGAAAVAGVHCCAPADWAAMLQAGPTLVSVPVEVARTLRAPDIGPFLERGGWVAWGAVPTDGPVAGVDGHGAARLWRALGESWHALADGGVDPVLLRQRALITPACGLVRHDEAQVALALRLTTILAGRIAAGRPTVAVR